MILAVFLYRWLFFSENFLVGSKKEEDVDTIGEIGTHFERFRYILLKLPDWMLAMCDWNKKNSAYMRLWKDNGSGVVGDSMTSGFSRQSRHNAILLDEFAFVDGAELIYRAAGDSAPCKIAVSTPNGKNNYFAKLRFSGQVKVYSHHWKLHPEKDLVWYEEQKKGRSAKDIAQELDINYTVSAGEPFYLGFSRGLHVRKMNIIKERDLILGFDYGFNHPNCCIFQISPEGIGIIVDNIRGANQTADEFAEYCKIYFNTQWPGYKISYHNYGDPAGNQSSDKSKKTSAMILKDHGFNVLSIPSNSIHGSYANRKAIIERKLRTMIGSCPSLVVNDTKNNELFIEGFEGGYRYPDANKYGGVAEKPIHDDYYSNAFNSFEYIMVNLFRAVEVSPAVQEEREQRVRNYAHANSNRSNAGFGDK